MIDKDSLLAVSPHKQPYQGEKDYIEEMFLSGVFDALDYLVLKGGTALSKFYGSARFSDDLDFSPLQARRTERLAETLEKVIGRLGSDYPIRVMRKTDSNEMLVYELSIRGPLFEAQNKYQHLKLEVDKGFPTIETVGSIRRNPVYGDLKPYLALVMGGKEILAEKTEALLYRRNLKARDLYDIYFLLGRETELKVGLIDKKMREHGKTFTETILRKRIEAVGKIWDKELTRLLPPSNVVDYQLARGTVLDNFAKAGLF